MKLIGLFDSPFVRRVAVSFHAMELSFDHLPLSVFRNVEEFTTHNPVIKAPTLVTEDGVVLMDSTLILDYAERLVPEERRLSPQDPDTFTRAQRIIGLALVACEKSVQLVYERRLRPEDKQHAPWMERAGSQLREACQQLETEIGTTPAWLVGPRPMQADITTAVAWRFIREMTPDDVPAANFPSLAALAERAEALPIFQAVPFHG